MTDHHAPEGDIAPGDEPFEIEGGIVQGVWIYLVGLVLAGGLTAVSFLIGPSHLVWAPSIPIALVVLAVSQMGVHLVFFLHINTGPDGTNNVLALAFGLLIVFLIMTGSLWIMAHLNHNMMSMSQIMRMQR
jgi:cytochrome o ubiquinol oxidase operon protein cyoD